MTGDPSHPAHQLFEPLPSGGRLWSSTPPDSPAVFQHFWAKYDEFDLEIQWLQRCKGTEGGVFSFFVALEWRNLRWWRFCTFDEQLYETWHVSSMSRTKTKGRLTNTLRELSGVQAVTPPFTAWHQSQRAGDEPAAFRGKKLKTTSS